MKKRQLCFMIVMAGFLVTVGFSIAFAQCEATETPAELTCDDQIDNDCDGVTDCDDEDCAATAACLAAPTVDAACFDEAAEADSFTDCASCLCDLAYNTDLTLQCQNRETVEGDCTNGLDDDANAATDCADPACACSLDCGGTGCTVKEEPASPAASEADVEGGCSNCLDDDNDGLSDENDEDCSVTEEPETPETPEEPVVEADGLGANDCISVLDGVTWKREAWLTEGVGPYRAASNQCEQFFALADCRGREGKIRALLKITHKTVTEGYGDIEALADELRSQLEGECSEE